MAATVTGFASGTTSVDAGANGLVVLNDSLNTTTVTYDAAVVVNGQSLFSQAGVQTYGFLPMRLPEGFAFTKLIHAADGNLPSDLATGSSAEASGDSSIAIGGSIKGGDAGTLGVVRHVDGRVPERHHGIANIFVNRAVLALNRVG